MSGSADFQYIDKPTDLEQLCHSLRTAPVIAFDTEFVSEDCYQPELCLIQVAAGGQLAIIDALALEHTQPFWELLVGNGHETVVHAAREEFRFCHQFTGQRPAGLFDIQVAAGLVGLEYPAALATLANKVLQFSLQKNETRTNWRRRPLNKDQLEYAINDVVHLESIHATIRQKLEKLDRQTWLAEEMDLQQSELEKQESGEKWRKLSGSMSLSRKELVIVSELWQWREDEAKRKNMPARRVLRDDLIVELARRSNSNIKRIRSLRGMEHGRLQRFLPQISAAIERGLKMPKDQWPQRSSKSRVPNLGLLGQFLATALGVICRNAAVAPNLVGTSQQLRTLAAWRLGLISLDDKPQLMCGWREKIIGEEIDKLLSGMLSIRIDDPASDQPLVIERSEKA